MKKFAIIIEVEDDITPISLEEMEDIIDDAMNDNGIECIFNVEEKEE